MGSVWPPSMRSTFRDKIIPLIFTPHIYVDVARAKLKCRPCGIQICEKKLKSLQNLLDRILTMQEEFLETFPNIMHCILIATGSTGQSCYSQGFQIDESISMDYSLFVTQIIPFKLTDEWDQDTTVS